jgi:hypothetical protein
MIPSASVAYEFLTSAVRDPSLPFADRLRAAAILLSYEKRRIQPLQPLGRKERVVEDAEEAAQGIYEPAAAPKREAALGAYDVPLPPRKPN